MPKFKNIQPTLAIPTAIAAAVIVSGIWSLNSDADSKPSMPAIGSAHAQTANPDETETAQRWAASATGRIEPSSGHIRLMPEISGQITDVLVSTNDKVVAGDLLIVLDEGDISDKIIAARAEVDVRKRERKDRRTTGLAKDRQDAADELADARRELFTTTMAFDDAYRIFQKDDGSSYAVTTARDTLNRAKKKVEETRQSLKDISAKSKMPRLTRLETALVLARANLAIAERAFARTRVRAPFDGTVLNVFANPGDMASPTARQPLLAFGDISHMRVRAEVEERDIANVRIGQKVILRTDAFPGRDFLGTVTEIASALGTPRIATRGPRRPNDVDVLEVVAKINGTPPLITGMRVDVFFKPAEGDANNGK